MPGRRYNPGVFVFTGCTAAGKTAVARVLAAKHNLEILSADSMQVYRGMNVGTDKVETRGAPPPDIGGLDLVNPDENFSVGMFLDHAREFFKKTAESGRGLLVVGGSGLYVKVLLEGLRFRAADPDKRRAWDDVYEREGVAGLRDALRALRPDRLAELADPENPRRLIRALERIDEPRDGEDLDGIPADLPRKPVVGLFRPREILRRLVEKRVDRMWAAGLLEETEELVERFPAWSRTARQAIGYAEALAVLNNEMTPCQARERIRTRTMRLAKKQMTWFRHQLDVEWVCFAENESIDEVAERVWRVFMSHGESARWVPHALSAERRDER